MKQSTIVKNDIKHLITALEDRGHLPIDHLINVVKAHLTSPNMTAKRLDKCHKRIGELRACALRIVSGWASPQTEIDYARAVLDMLEHSKDVRKGLVRTMTEEAEATSIPALAA